MTLPGFWLFIQESYLASLKAFYDGKGFYADAGRGGKKAAKFAGKYGIGLLADAIKTSAMTGVMPFAYDNIASRNSGYADDQTDYTVSVLRNATPQTISDILASVIVRMSSESAVRPGPAGK